MIPPSYKSRRWLVLRLISLAWLVGAGVHGSESPNAAAAQHSHQVEDDYSLQVLEDEVLPPPLPALFQKAPDCSNPQERRLECWLWNLEIQIPPQSFKDWITIDIKHMVCTHFQLAHLVSEYDPQHHATLSASVSQLFATCSGSYHSTGGLSGNVRASVIQASKSHPALDVQFQLSNTVEHLPNKFTTKTCETHLKADNIHFTGSMSAKLIQVFAKTISNYITEALHSNICPIFNQQVDPLVTGYLKEFDDWAKQYIVDDDDEATTIIMRRLEAPSQQHQQGSSTTPEYGNHDRPSKNHESILLAQDTDNVYPQDLPTVRWILDLFNSQLQQHLQQGWFFGTAECTAKDCKNMFRGLSGWLVSLLGETIDIRLPHYFQNVSLPLPMGTSGSIGMQHLYIQGLDLLDSLQILVPNPDDDDDKGLDSIVSTHKGFHIKVPLKVHFQLPHAKSPLDESLEVHVNITKLETILLTMIQVVDWETTSVLQVVDAIQDYIDTKNWRHVSCLVRTFSSVQLTDWATTLLLESISIVNTKNKNKKKSYSLEDDIDGVINTAFQLATTEYEDIWTSLFRGLVQGPGRRHLEQFIGQYIQDHSSQHKCPTPSPKSKPKWMNFTKVELLYRMNEFFNHAHTLKTMNHFLDCVGTLLVEQTMNNSTNLLQISKMETKDWNQLLNFVLIEPQNDRPNVLTSQIDWGQKEQQASSPNMPQTSITLEIPHFNTTVNVTVFGSFHTKVGMQMDYNLNVLQNVTVTHMLEHGQCAMLPAMEFRLLPESYFQPTVGLNVSALINQTHWVHLSSLEYDEVSDFLDTMVDWSVEWVRQLGNQVSEQVLVKSPETCPGIMPPNDNDDDNGSDDDTHHHHPDPHSLPWNRNPFVWVIAMMLCLGQYGLVWIAQGLNEAPEIEDSEDNDNVNGDFVTPTRQRRPIVISESIDEVCINPLEESGDLDQRMLLDDMREMDRSLLSDIRDQIDQEHDQFILAGQTPRASARELEEEDAKRTLLMETRLPSHVRMVLPALCIGTMVLLFASNVSVGASVDLSFQMADRLVHLPALFEFSLGNTVTDLFQAGIYPLCFLVVVFSGIWPYAKLALMVYVWIVPYPNAHKREERLLLLDALSKFSLVDTYVLVIMLVAFRFHLEITEVIGLDVYVTPRFGFYAFLLATSLSLVLGHAMLYFHRRAAMAPVRSSTAEQQGRSNLDIESVYGHLYDVGEDRNDEGRPASEKRLSLFFKLVFFLASLAAIGLLVAGFILDTFSFEFGGLAGMALGDGRRTSYSLISLGAAIPKSVENAGSPAVWLLQVAYYFYAVITPLTCLVLVLALMIVPMSLFRQRSLMVAAEIAHAWSAVEVFVISIYAALLQISTFASFIIGDRCDIINILLRDAMDSADDDHDTVCFTVEASCEQEFWYLVGGAVLTAMVSSFGLRLAHVAMDERLAAALATTTTSASATGSDEWTMAKQMFRIPGLSCLCFSSASGEAASQGDDEEASETPEWRH